MREIDYMNTEQIKTDSIRMKDHYKVKIEELDETKKYVEKLYYYNSINVMDGDSYKAFCNKLIHYNKVAIVLQKAMEYDMDDCNVLYRTVMDGDGEYDGKELVAQYNEAVCGRNAELREAEEKQNKAQNANIGQKLYQKQADKALQRADDWDKIVNECKRQMEYFDETETKSSSLFYNSQELYRSVKNALNELKNASESTLAGTVVPDSLSELNKYIEASRSDVMREIDKILDENYDIFISPEQILDFIKENYPLIYDEMMANGISEDMLPIIEEARWYWRLIMSNFGDYYADSNNFMQRTINGKNYYWEIQHGGSGPWNQYKPQANSMDQSGCFYYGLAAALSALLGRPVTILELIRMLGGEVEYRNGKFYVVNNPISYGQGLNGGTDVANNILEKYGYQCGNDSNFSIDDVKEGLKNGATYLYYYRYKTYDKDGNPKYNTHWVCFAGLDEDGNIIVLCSNGGQNRQMIIENDFKEVSSSWDSHGQLITITEGTGDCNA